MAANDPVPEADEAAGTAQAHGSAGTERTGKRPGPVVRFALTALALLYLANPSAGLFEFLPDNLPLVGNLDEAGAVLLLVKCLGWYGLDLSWLLPGGRKEAPPPPSP